MPRYIDAEMLMQKTCNMCGVKDRENFCRAHCGDKIIIDSIPTADVELVRSGRWCEPFGGYSPFCSECHSVPTASIKTRYCPHCGAKMDESERISTEAEEDRIVAAGIGQAFNPD